MLWVALILGSIAILMMRGDKKKKINQYFDFEDSGDLANLHAININELTNRKRWQSLMSDARLVADVLGPRSALYITLYTLGTAFMLWYVMTEIARWLALDVCRHVVGAAIYRLSILGQSSSQAVYQ